MPTISIDAPLEVNEGENFSVTVSWDVGALADAPGNIPADLYTVRFSCETSGDRDWKTSESSGTHTFDNVPAGGGGVDLELGAELFENDETGEPVTSLASASDSVTVLGNMPG